MTKRVRVFFDQRTLGHVFSWSSATGKCSVRIFRFFTEFHREMCKKTNWWKGGCVGERERERKRARERQGEWGVGGGREKITWSKQRPSLGATRSTNKGWLETVGCWSQNLGRRRKSTADTCRSFGPSVTIRVTFLPDWNPFINGEIVRGRLPDWEPRRRARNGRCFRLLYVVSLSLFLHFSFSLCSLRCVLGEYRERERR